MTFNNSIRNMRALALLGTLATTLAVAACDDDNTNITGADPNRVYTQIERLGNPLTSEVFFPKRDHGLHNTKGPADDGKTMDNGGTDVPGHIRSFVSAFPTRSEQTITTLQAVLTPDVLLVFPNRAASTSGWLTWALANGYGGRNLSDDVVDAGLSAVFGNLLDPAQPVLAGLTSDNVAPTSRTFSATFPYLEAPR
jgi:hypothetical protein